MIASLIENEQEAAAIILFSCLLHDSKVLSEAEVGHISRMMASSPKLANVSLDDISIKALALHPAYGSMQLIRECSLLVAEDFK